MAVDLTIHKNKFDSKTDTRKLDRVFEPDLNKNENENLNEYSSYLSINDWNNCFYFRK